MLALNQINKQNEEIIELKKAVKSRDVLIEQQSSSAFSKVHVFKIQNFNQTLSISKHYYSPQGYKFSTWASANEESDISLWFRSVKSPFHDTLEWPMKLERLECCVIDEMYKVKLSHSMVPGIDDLTYLIKKPPHEGGIGWSKFIPSSELASCLDGDGTLTIRIQMKFGD